MRVCYFDAFSGCSGDMTIGALLDAGADFAGLCEALTALGLGASFRAGRTRNGGITATQFQVEGGEAKSHRHLSHIYRILDAAPLAEGVRGQARAVFARLGEAEAAVHGVPIEKVHFHEVGAVDSICDIVGACWCLDNLGVEQVRASAVNVGSGTVMTDHGMLPVPAPATAALLKGKPIYARGPEAELTTPTGAAILSTLAAGFGPMPPLAIDALGYGSGTKDFPGHANVLRAILGTLTSAPETTTVAVLEANIDDSTPEVLGYAMERLLEDGALDVTLQPVWMKKNRPGTQVQVIARPEDRERLAALLLRETSTLGVRFHTAERRVEERRVEEVETPWGTVRVKVAPGGAAPEYDDCRRLALASGVPLKTVFAEAAAACLRARKGTS